MVGLYFYVQQDFLKQALLFVECIFISVSNVLGGPRPYARMCSVPSSASHSIFIQAAIRVGLFQRHQVGSVMLELFQCHGHSRTP